MRYLAMVFVVCLAACGDDGSSDSGGDTSQSSDNTETGDDVPASDDDAPAAPEDSDDDPTETTEPPALDNPPLVTIDYAAEGCAPVTACGGELLGGWYFSSSCTTAVDFEPILDVVDTFCGDGNSSISSFSGTIIGTAVFGETQLVRTSTRAQTVGLTLGGDTCGTTAGCVALQAALTTAGIPGASCTPQVSAKTCTCVITESAEVTTTDDYTVVGNQFVLSNPTRTYDYCVSDGTVSYQLSSDTSTDVTVLVAP